MCGCDCNRDVRDIARSCRNWHRTALTLTLMGVALNSLLGPFSPSLSLPTTELLILLILY